MPKKKTLSKKELLKQVKKLEKEKENAKKKQMVDTIEEAEDIIKETKVGYARELGRMKAVKDSIEGSFKKDLKYAAIFLLIGIILIVIGSVKSSPKTVWIGILFCFISVVGLICTFKKRDQQKKEAKVIE